LGGAAAGWPLAARAQQADRMRRIGVLNNPAADDPDSQARVAAFAQALQELGWIDGRNVRIDYRWSSGDPDRIRRYAAELVALAPDVILATGAATVRPYRAAPAHSGCNSQVVIPSATCSRPLQARGRASRRSLVSGSLIPRSEDLIFCQPCAARMAQPVRLTPQVDWFCDLSPTPRARAHRGAIPARD
ncbi:MAG: hypothetical protein QOD29_4552, partial [Alphaproteobacteria bacterium]|nr:hypothetical protein [Alphaproteobacteria bacterium]